MKNTTVISVIGGLAFGLILFIMCCCTGCRVIKSKSNTEVHTSVKDTAGSETEFYVNTSDSVDHSVEKTDTGVQISGNTISLTLDSNSKGKDTTIRDGIHSLHVYTDDKGNQKIDCRADSFMVIIRKLTKERDYYKGHRDTTQGKTQYKERVVTETKLHTEYVEKSDPWWKVIINWIIVAVIAVLLWEIIKKVISYVKLSKLL